MKKTPCTDRNADAVVEMMLDATQKYDEKLTEERLFSWHACLFPTGYSGMSRIEVAKYRSGAMQVVSGAIGMEKVHYEAPDAERVGMEMEKFLSWLNSDKCGDSIVNAAIAHIWFVTIHPFEDGNGRIARAISDMMLSRSDRTKLRFYSMSNQISQEKKEYYEVLEQCQHSTLDITPWARWFVQCLMRAIENSMSETETEHELQDQGRRISLGQRAKCVSTLPAHCKKPQGNCFSAWVICIVADDPVGFF